jgi:hypothetical protein
MDGPTIQSILREHYPAFEQAHPLPTHVRDAVHAILCCRTAALGGHKQSCPDGHYTHIWYNSCKHRACPQCAYLETAHWLEAQQARLLACEHYHAIFTIPHELNDLWLLNTAFMINLLFHTVKDVLVEMLADPRYLGATPGILLALHTWGQTLILHPHIHCLITGGGLEGEQWKAVSNGFLLPVVKLMEIFRERLLSALGRALDKGQLELPPGQTGTGLKKCLDKLREVKWNVHIRERYAHGEGVAHYLARYLRGGPIGNSRLLPAPAGKVSFKYYNNHDKDESGRGKADIMTLSAEQFLQRLFLHVPPPRMQTVRSYGLYANTKAEVLDRCRHQLGQGPVEKPERLGWQDYWAGQDDRHPECCPICGKRLIAGAIIAPQPQRPKSPLVPRSGAPPVVIPAPPQAA